MRGIKKTGLPSSIPLPKFGAGTLISQRHECVRIKYDFWPRLGILIDTITIHSMISHYTCRYVCVCVANCMSFNSLAHYVNTAI